MIINYEHILDHMELPGRCWLSWLRLIKVDISWQTLLTVYQTVADPIELIQTDI